MEGDKYEMKKVIQNSAILLLILSGINNLLLALPLRYNPHINQRITKAMDPNFIVVHHMFSFLVGCIMLILAFRLYKRVRVAWMIEVITLTISIVLKTLQYHRLFIPIIGLEILVLLILLIGYRDFSRKADRITVRKALCIIGISFFLVLLNACVALFIMKKDILDIKNILDALICSVQLLIFMDKNILHITGGLAAVYADAIIVVNWICIMASVVLLLKPLIYNPISSKWDKEKVRGLVMAYGQNPMAYLALEDDKKYFFGAEVKGVCAYEIVGSVFVVCGDMICAKEDGFAFLNEVLAFCHQNGYEMVFLNVTDYFMDLYKLAGFSAIKYGEDACFNLEAYNLKGGKVAKVRAAINHANKTGIAVKEYKPLQGRNKEIEQQISEITEEWLAHKGNDEMHFMLGGTGLENPMDRRYFYAVDAQGKMVGYVVFLPYLSGKGYLADVTRRKNDAIQGVLEKIIYEAFMTMKEEGATWGNLGLSPLYHVAEQDKATITERLFNYIYENMNVSYSFKALHHAKEKYAPTHWIPRYLVYTPAPFSLNYAYAMVSVQVGRQLPKMVIEEISKRSAIINKQVKNF